MYFSDRQIHLIRFFSLSVRKPDSVV